MQSYIAGITCNVRNTKAPNTCKWCYEEYTRYLTMQESLTLINKPGGVGTNPDDAHMGLTPSNSINNLPEMSSHCTFGLWHFRWCHFRLCGIGYPIHSVITLALQTPAEEATKRWSKWQKRRKVKRKVSGMAKRKGRMRGGGYGDHRSKNTLLYSACYTCILLYISLYTAIAIYIPVTQIYIAVEVYRDVYSI